MLGLITQLHNCGKQFLSLEPSIKTSFRAFWNGKCNPSIAIYVLSDTERDRILRRFAAWILDARSFDVMGEVIYEVYQIERDQSDCRCGLRHSELGVP
jgi:hypothetical protein